MSDAPPVRHAVNRKLDTVGGAVPLQPVRRGMGADEPDINVRSCALDVVARYRLGSHYLFEMTTAFLA